jgi:hypothetical protein
MRGKGRGIATRPQASILSLIDHSLPMSYYSMHDFSHDASNSIFITYYVLLK